jgi:formylglycine-generating enzyme required for sulfatase activity
MCRLAALVRFPVAVVVPSLVAGLALLGPGLAQAEKGKKYALLVGVRKYDSEKFEDLRFTENDVEELARVLRDRAGFTSVHVLTTTRGQRRGAAPTAANVRAALEALLARKTKHDTILVALAGHGILSKVKGKEKEDSFFCPADAQMNDAGTLVGLSKLVQDLDDCGARIKLLLVDACRNDPKAGRSVDVETLPRLPRGTATLFSCSSGERAFETAKLGKGHGVFFYHVLQGLEGKAKNADGEVRWSNLAEYVTQSVSRAVPKLIGEGAQQTPELKVNLRGESPLLVGPDQGPVARPEGPPTVPGAWWTERWLVGSAILVLGLGPILLVSLLLLRRGVALLAAPPARETQETGSEIVNSIGMKLVRIPKGTFTMGSPASEKHRSWDEDQHEVEITKDFYLGVYEVTQKQFKSVMGFNPSFFSADGKGKPGEEYKHGKPGEGKDKVVGSTADFPVENVSWAEAVEFCKKLSELPGEKKAGRKYRLPAEAEWEYACRGGTTTPFHFGNSLSSTQANFKGNKPYGGAGKGDYLERTCKVGSYRANKFGLYDMHGNVWEWCNDWHDSFYYGKSPRRDPPGPESGSSRVIRGGGWSSSGENCRSANRWYEPASRHEYLGFRVALSSADQ